MFFVTSDLHYDFGAESNRATEALARYLATHATSQDVLLVNGDIGNDDQAVLRCLGLFQDFPGRKAAVPGNHDIWVEGEGESSFVRYLRFSDLLQSVGFEAFISGSMLVGEWGIAGSMGWYDYTFADLSGMPRSAYEAKVAPREVAQDHHVAWSDVFFARWGRCDEEITLWQLDLMERQLAALRAQGARKILALTHHVAHKKLLVHPRALVPAPWRYLNAFLGSQKFAELFARYPEIRVAVSGHIHLQAEHSEGPTKYLSVGASYKQKQLLCVYDEEYIRRLNFS